MLLVMGFEILLLAVWGVAYRQVGSAYRVELARTLRRTRDDGVMTALGQGVALLQTGTPPSQPYTCYVQLDGISGPGWYVVTFAPASQTPSGQTLANLWSVQAQPANDAGTPLMPITFATP
jgi:hypothetical protein